MMLATSGQASVREVRISTIMTSPLFLQGMAEFHLGLPFSTDKLDARRAAVWRYERGRLFAAASGRISPFLPGRAKRLDPAAEREYIQLREAKVIL